MEDLPHSRGCFVCGAENRIGFRLRFRTDGQKVEADYTPRSEHNGFVGVVHGGLLATLLDEAMVWACAVRTQHFSYCAEMTTRFLEPAHPDQPLIVAAWLAENKRGRLFLAESEVRTRDGKVLTTGTGKYMPIRNIDRAILVEDFAESPEQLALFRKHFGA